MTARLLSAALSARALTGFIDNTTQRHSPVNLERAAASVAKLTSASSFEFISLCFRLFHYCLVAPLISLLLRGIYYLN